MSRPPAGDKRGDGLPATHSRWPRGCWLTGIILCFPFKLAFRQLFGTSSTLNSPHTCVSLCLFILCCSGEGSLGPPSGHGPPCPLVPGGWAPALPPLPSSPPAFTTVCSTHISVHRKAYCFCVQNIFKVQPFLIGTGAPTSSKTLIPRRAGERLPSLRLRPGRLSTRQPK